MTSHEDFSEDSGNGRKQLNEQQALLDAIHVEQLKQQVKLMQSLGSVDFSPSNAELEGQLALDRAVLGVQRMSSPPSLPQLTFPTIAQSKSLPSVATVPSMTNVPNINSYISALSPLPSRGNLANLATSPSNPSPLNPNPPSAMAVRSSKLNTSSTSPRNSPMLLATALEDLHKQALHSSTIEDFHKQALQSTHGNQSQLANAVQQVMGLVPIPGKARSVSGTSEVSESELGSSTNDSGKYKRKRDLTDAERRENRKHINREAAKRARERKRVKQSELEEQHEILMQENQQVKQLIQQLLAERQELSHLVRPSSIQDPPKTDRNA
jgi:hypothetical protein